ncbi:MAG: VWA domain-containing protein [Candidatus Margulisiibacteriota bacterium]
MIFGNGFLWPLFIVVPLVLAILAIGALRRKRNLQILANSSAWALLLVGNSPTRRFWKRVLWVLVLAGLVGVVLRPQFGTKSEQVGQKGRDIVIALDTSLSMLTPDSLPTRFDFAKSEIQGLIQLAQADRLGLIVFAGNAWVQCPLTAEKEAVSMFVDSVQVGTVPEYGTNVASAIETAITGFQKPGAAEKILVIFTDGEALSGDAQAAAKKAKRAGITVFTVGVGTPQGQPIPLPQDDGVIALKKDGDNRVVVSKLNEAQLKAIAAETGGTALFTGQNQHVYNKLYRAMMVVHETTFGSHWLRKQHEDRYQWLLGLVLVLLLVEWALPEVRSHDE